MGVSRSQMGLLDWSGAFPISPLRRLGAEKGTQPSTARLRLSGRSPSLLRHVSKCFPWFPGLAEPSCQWGFGLTAVSAGESLEPPGSPGSLRKSWAGPSLCGHSYPHPAVNALWGVARALLRHNLGWLLSLVGGDHLARAATQGGRALLAGATQT